MRASVNGTNIAYDDHGIGQPLLFLHAFPLNRSMWSGELMALLQDGRFRLVALDWRGFGESDTTVGISTMEQLADDVAGLMDELGMQNAILCGLSMGGYAAFAFLRKYPERVKGLILADTRPGADTDEEAGDGRGAGSADRERALQGHRPDRARRPRGQADRGARTDDLPVPLRRLDEQAVL